MMTQQPPAGRSSRHVAIVTAHFVPSNLAGVHRSRLLVEHLHEAGWRPTVVCVDPRHYEETADPELESTLSADLRVVKSGAMPILPGRPFGDIGLRGFWGLFRAIRTLHARDPLDFVLVVIPSNYTALLGPLVHGLLEVPYGIDYVDPWVADGPLPSRRGVRAWIAARLGRLLEPIAVRRARLISGIAEGYFRGVFDRNPRLTAKTLAMPYGWSERDYACARAAPGKLLFDPGDGLEHVVYAGAIVPSARAILEALLSALAASREEWCGLRLHFIGTMGVAESARRHGLSDAVLEHPERLPYLDVLRNLASSAGVLVLGGTARHYSPSKIFQAILSGRPVLSFLHERSTAVEIVRDSRCGPLVLLDDEGLKERASVVAGFRELRLLFGAETFSARLEVLDRYSSKRSAELLARALDDVTEEP